MPTVTATEDTTRSTPLPTVTASEDTTYSTPLPTTEVEVQTCTGEAQPLHRHIVLSYSYTQRSLNSILCYPTATSSNPLLPAVVFLTVVVLLLITCVALLAVALAVTANKLVKSRAEKAHTDPPHYYEQTGGGEGKVKDGIYAEVEEGAAPTGGQWGHYQELELGTMEGRQYESLSKTNTTAKA